MTLPFARRRDDLSLSHAELPATLVWTSPERRLALAEMEAAASADGGRRPQAASIPARDTIRKK